MPRPGRRACGAMLVATMALAVGCSGDDDTGGNGETGGDATLGPVGSGAGTVAGAATAEPSSESTVVTMGDVGDGFVSLQVRVNATGVDEVIALDRATVANDQLDPRSLDAECTFLDGGEDWTVSVTDLRRMSAGNRLISAALRADAPVDAAGEHPVTLEVGDNQQVITSYAGTVLIADDLASGSFDVADSSGGVATGSFVCGAEAATATTVPAATVPTSARADEVPGSDLPVPTAPAVTVPPVTVPPVTVPPATVPPVTVPPLTVPIATS